MSAVIFPAQPEQILKGLSKLWTSLGEEEKQLGKPTVLRACAMTLIVATDGEGAGFDELQIMSELMREHPSRGIVLAVSPEAEHGLEARVLAQCWKPFGKAQQICCEQIEITARPESWPNVGPTLIGLITPDLPVVFWCRHKGALSPSATADQNAGLDAILDLASKVVIDSLGLDPTSTFRLLAKWQAQGHVVADLEWTRLTPWREPIAHIFDSLNRENKFSDFHTIEVTYTGDKPGSSALYAAGWLSAPYRAQVRFTKVEGGNPGLRAITLRSDKETIVFECTGRDTMRLHSTNGRHREYTLTHPSLTTLMTEELALIGPDPAFNAAFARAQELL